MKTRLLFLGVAVATIALAQPLGAASDTKPLTVNATVAATAKLTVSSATVAFADADPDVTPSITASGGAITVTAKGKTSAAGNITLTILAGADLTSGSDTIPIANVTWTATGDLVAGTMSKTIAQSVGSWTGSGSRTGTQTYKLANSWDYVTGSYTASATYTMTAP
ncbi:MAG: hypothetical protein NTY02_01845 [Acidobacteria bacterium]|nr:hypothetical protein [Acidobacteriota bacterium]